MEQLHDLDRTHAPARIAHPIIQGPFGGVPTVQLAAAVGKAGGLGSYGCYTNSPDEITRIAADIRALTDKPFMLNLWVSVNDPGGDRLDPDRFEAAWKIFAPLYAELGVDKPRPPERLVHGFDAQVDALIEARPAVFSFIFGIPKPSILAECSRRGIVTVGAVRDSCGGRGAGPGRRRCDPCDRLRSGRTSPVLPRPRRGQPDGNAAPSPASSRRRSSGPSSRQAALSTRRESRRPSILAPRRCSSARLSLPARIGRRPTAASRHAVLGCRAAHGADSRLFRPAVPRHSQPADRDAHTLRPTGMPPFPIPGWFTAPLRRAAAEQGRTDFMALLSGQGAPLLKHRNVASLMESLTAAG